MRLESCWDRPKSVFSAFSRAVVARFADFLCSPEVCRQNPDALSLIGYFLYLFYNYPFYYLFLGQAFALNSAFNLRAAR